VDEMTKKKKIKCQGQVINARLPFRFEGSGVLSTISLMTKDNRDLGFLYLRRGEEHYLGNFYDIEITLKPTTNKEFLQKRGLRPFPETKETQPV